MLDSKRRSAALDIALHVAVRASDPRRIAEALGAAGEQTRYPLSLRWEPHGIGSGDAGVAVLCGYVDACMPGEGWDRLAHDFVVSATEGAERSNGLPPGLFSGLSGLAFAVASLSRQGARYARLLGALDDRLAPDALAVGAGLLPRDRPLEVSAFDVISGASGVAAYLLLRDPHRVLPDMLAGLVSLTDASERPPRWSTPPELLDETMRRLYPWGNLNCGLAHGIPGPLALLALALQTGHEVPGQAEAIRRVAEWLLAHSMDDEWGINWSSAVPLLRSGKPANDNTSWRAARSAWCYGSPGVARALWLAGEALDDAFFRDRAVEAMLTVLHRPVAQRQIDSPTLCHGIAGLLLVLLRFANDTGIPAFAEASGELVDQLIGIYDPDRPLGYASLEPGGNSVDRAGLLDGAPGVAMALLAAATDVEPTWDRLFLLS